MRRNLLSPFNTASLLLLLLIGTACETIENSVKTRLPKVAPEAVRIANASFQDVDLNLDLAVDNGNPFALPLKGFDYDFQIQDQTLLSGNSTETRQIAANQISPVSIPINVPFQKLADTIPNLLDQDEVPFNLAANLRFQIPVLGIINVPVQQSGTLPILRAPTLQDMELKKESLNLTGAKLRLKMAIANPNAFAMNLNALNYNFSANGNTWAKGKAKNPIQLPKKGDGTVEIPITLDFLALGRTAFQLLSGNQDLSTQLDGSMAVDSSLPYFSERTVPFEFSKALALQ